MLKVFRKYLFCSTRTCTCFHTQFWQLRLGLWKSWAILSPKKEKSKPAHSLIDMVHAIFVIPLHLSLLKENLALLFTMTNSATHLFFWCTYVFFVLLDLSYFYLSLCTVCCAHIAFLDPLFWKFWTIVVKGQGNCKLVWSELVHCRDNSSIKRWTYLKFCWMFF